MTPPHAQGPGSFAERLNLLFEACAPEDPDKPGHYVEYTNQQVADEINRRHGDDVISSEYIRRLRKPNGPNPTEKYLSVLADFFQVPLDAFKITGKPSEIAQKVMEEAQRFVDARRQQQREEQEAPDIAVLARAARRLSPANQARAAQYVSKLEQLEQMEHEANG
ncbi:hypothetical protein ACLQ16_03725 [Streptomyces albidoflavus]|uniref:hypothetical protein n=1 Tax=Streptomyces albidoflavus TaxID=1886 RepID=UPI000A1C9A74|nr:hypothetical protein [Streptomyces albidoflavus]